MPTSVSYHSEMFAIAHFGLASDSIRIGADFKGAHDNIDALAFQNTTHNILQLFNSGDNDMTVQVNDVASNQCFSAVITAHSLSSFVYDVPATLPLMEHQ